jgi:hypothetical protein
MMWADAYPLEYFSAGAPAGDEAAVESTISAVFEGREPAEAAIIELRRLGILPTDISVISRDGSPQIAGVAEESLGDGDLTYTASRELPNDEDLPTTLAQMTGKDPLATSQAEALAGEPTSAVAVLGPADIVRRNDASADADLDIYTDFPDKPGGINPASPAASRAGQAATEQVAVGLGEERAGSAIVVAGLGSLAGLLIGVTSLAIPGVGPIVAAGPLATALGSMLAGGAAGGIIGALSTSGVPQEYARRYAASMQDGQTLVSVRTDPISLDAIERVLVAHGGEEVVVSG